MHSGLSITHLMLAASLPVQILMSVLTVMCLVTLYLTGKKLAQFSRLNRKLKQFQQSFWHSRDLQQLYEHYLAHNAEGIEALFVAGFREFKQFTAEHLTASDVIVGNSRRAMETAMIRESMHQERWLNLLATFASSAPYIGLFGTVCGIINSFIALGGSAQQASINSVAPGIAEALIATAAGLLVAIPSVLAYNYFIDRSDRLNAEYESFLEEFSNIQYRQILTLRTKRHKS